MSSMIKTQLCLCCRDVACARKKIAIPAGYNGQFLKRIALLREREKERVCMYVERDREAHGPYRYTSNPLPVDKADIMQRREERTEAACTHP